MSLLPGSLSYDKDIYFLGLGCFKNILLVPQMPAWLF
jgi:hypothetical protein